MFAAQEKLSNLTMIVDYNRVQALGHAENVIDLRSLKDKLTLFGFAVREINGHSCEEICDALSAVPFDRQKPTAIIAHTVKCKGIPELENTVRSHYRFVADEDIDAVIKAIEEAE